MAGNKIRAFALVAAVAVMAACSGDSVSAPGTPSALLVPVPPDANYFNPVASAVKICSFDTPGTYTTVSAVGIAETPKALGVECYITWIDNGAAAPVNVTVNQTVGTRIWRVAIFHTNGALFQNFQDPLGCAGTAVIPSSHTITQLGGDAGAAIWYKHCPGTPPPPPGCNGLTPGYWKSNALKKYTPEQFAMLIDETSFPNLTNEDAIEILGNNDPQTLDKLLKFTLANELTMALTNHPELANPSGGNLTDGCVLVLGGANLAGVLLEALNILNGNPEGLDQAAWDAIANLLDAFANL